MNTREMITEQPALKTPIRKWAWIKPTILVILVVLIGTLFTFFFAKKSTVIAASPGEIVELNFELDKKFQFGEYFFDISNGKEATYPLCFCLTEKNTYPPNCTGDVKYLFKNTASSMCIPLKIGSGNCGIPPMETMGYASNFLVPMDYAWTKPIQKITMGIRVPPQAAAGTRLEIVVTIYKSGNQGKLVPYRVLPRAILVSNNK